MKNERDLNHDEPKPAKPDQNYTEKAAQTGRREKTELSDDQLASIAGGAASEPPPMEISPPQP